jgi:hypothetical protein
MANLFDYLNWRGDLSFSDVPFNPVDSLILSKFSQMPIETVDSDNPMRKVYKLGFLSKELVKADFSIFPNVPGEQDILFLKTLPKIDRFKSIKVVEYVNDVSIRDNIQFSAITFLTDDGFVNIAFRGTDGTVIGWEEDFRLCYSHAVPAQIKAEKYLKHIASEYKGPIRLMGHSKGGNLAIYSGAHAPEYIRRRIKDIYANDAPGFSSKEIAYSGHAKIRNKLHFYVPNSSFVGMILLHNAEYNVIKSDSFSLAQHNPYSWQVTKDGFVPAKLDRSSQIINKAIEQWYLNLSEDDLKTYIETVFDVIYSSKLTSFNELSDKGLSKLLTMAVSASRLDDTTKKTIKKVVNYFIKTTLLSFKDNVVRTIKRK